MSTFMEVDFERAPTTVTDILKNHLPVIDSQMLMHSLLFFSATEPWISAFAHTAHTDWGRKRVREW